MTTRYYTKTLKYNIRYQIKYLKKKEYQLEFSKYSRIFQKFKNTIEPTKKKLGNQINNYTLLKLFFQ